jgi:hypothetical protein
MTLSYRDNPAFQGTYQQLPDGSLAIPTYVQGPKGDTGPQGVKGDTGLAAPIGATAVGETTSVITCSAVIPVDDTAPQLSEGTQVISASITPTSASSNIEVSYNVIGSSTTGMFVTGAVFQDAISDALAGSTCIVQSTGNDQKVDLVKSFKVASGSTATRTFYLRVGPDSTGTVYVNGDANGSRLLGGVMKATINVREIF